MRYVVVSRGLLGQAKDGTEIRDSTTDIVTAEDAPSAIKKVAGGPSRYFMRYGIRYEAFELGPYCTTWLAAPEGDIFKATEIVLREAVA